MSIMPGAAEVAAWVRRPAPPPPDVALWRWSAGFPPAWDLQATTAGVVTWHALDAGDPTTGRPMAIDRVEDRFTGEGSCFETHATRIATAP